jgi:hypothetical protein
VLLLHDGRNERVGITVYSVSRQMDIQVLAFPHTMDGPFRIRFLTHPQYGATSPAAQARLFRPDPAVEVLPIDIQLNGLQGPSFFVVLSLHLFAKKCDELRRNHPDQHVFDWPEWGPSVSRLLPPDQLRNTGFRSTFGSRMLAVGNLSNERLDTQVVPFERLILLDFNPRPIRRGAQSHIRGRCHVLVEKELTEWSCPQLSLKMYSSLPVRAFVSHQMVEYLDIHLDGSTMICRKVRYTISLVLSLTRLKDHSYHIYSFLPRSESDPLEEEEECIDLV